MDLYIKGVPPAATNRSTAKLMKTGQTVTYQANDDGDLEAGRDVNFTTLAENNVFGNTNRFTDELGTQTYTKNIVIDWSTYDGSTVLGWRRTESVNVSWASAISGALAVSIAPFTTGWRLPNVNELNSIVNRGSSYSLSYAPINFPLYQSQFLWTSTTYINSTSNAFILYPFNGLLQFTGKANTSGTLWIPCRTFTVTGTTLS